MASGRIVFGVLFCAALLAFTGPASAIPTAAHAAGPVAPPDAVFTPAQQTLGAADSYQLTVSYATPAPAVTGEVDLWADGARQIGFGNLAVTGLQGSQVVSSLSFNVAAAALGVGLHTLSARYLGSSDYSGSISPALAGGVTATVLPAPAVGLTASQSSPADSGQPLTLTAVIARGVGGLTPTGAVSFFLGGAGLGVSTVDAAGTASLTILGSSPLFSPPQSVNFTASYSGDANTAPGTSPPLNLLVSYRPLAVMSPQQRTIPQAGAYDLTIQYASSAAPISGLVDLYSDGALLLAEGQLAVGPTSAAGTTLSTVALTVHGSALTVGTHSLTARYLGDSTYINSVSPLNLNGCTASWCVPVLVTIAPAAAVALSADQQSPVDGGRPLLLSATVATGPGGALPGGSVTFEMDGNSIGTAAVGAGGVATFQLQPSAFAPPQAALFTASYSGDGVNPPAVSAALSLFISYRPVATMTPRLEQLAPTGSYQLTITFNGGGTPVLGEVDVYSDGAQPLGGAQLVSGPGGVSTALVTIQGSQVAIGTHSLTARYSGDASHLGSVSPLNLAGCSTVECLPVLLTVGAATTTTALTVSAGGVAAVSVPYGTTVEERVEVRGNGGRPSGTVALNAGGSAHSLALAADPADALGAFAILSLAPHAGSYLESAAYPGGAGFGPSASTPVPLTVTPAPLTVTAADAFRTLLQPNPTFTATYAGLVAGDGPASLAGALTFATTATASSPAGRYPIYPGGLTSTDYGITFQPGTLTVYQASRFVVWGGNPRGLASGADVQFWGRRWSAQVGGGDYHGGSSFLGWASSSQGATWSATDGDSSKPPAAVGTYLAVIVTTHVSKAGSTILGDVSEVVLLRVDDPASYQPNAGHPGTGVVVAVLPG